MIASARVLSLFACGALACGTHGDVPDASTDAGDEYQPQAARCVRDAAAPPKFVADLDAGAASPREPQMVDFGGPVLALPTLVPITYAEDKFRDQEEDFVASIGCTDYWRAVTQDYGVGQAVTGTPMRLGSAPLTIDAAQIEAWISTLPKTDPDTLYVVFYPPKTSISALGTTSCNGFGGYHSSVGGVPYALVPNCGTYGGLSGLDAITAAASHEIVESVTNPTNAAWAAPEPDAYASLLGGGGEVADLCEHSSDTHFVPAGYPFWVQRSWSNSAAWAGDDPCQPAAQSAFFAAAPVLTSTVVVDAGFGAKTARGVTVPVGQSTTIDVVAFGKSAPASWSLSVYDALQIFGSDQELALSLDQTTVKAGDVVHLTIKRLAAPQSGFSGFAIFSTSGEHTSVFWGLAL